MLTGYHLPDLPGSFFFALRLTSKDEKLDDTNDPRRDTETGLLNKEAFAEFATQRIKDAEAEGEELKVTMLRLEDMGDLRTRLDAESDKDLMRTLGHCFDNGPATGMSLRNSMTRIMACCTMTDSMLMRFGSAWKVT